MINYLQAIILGLLQGVTEIFPISSLGHSVIFSWLFGWTNIVNSQSSSQSFFVGFLVLLHIATALGLFIFYRKTWIRIIKAFFSSLKKRKAETSSEKLVWLLIVATIPAGIVGLAFEKILRSQFAHPLAAIIFLFINGCILIIGDRYMKAHRLRQPKRDYLMDTTTKHTATKMTFKRAVLIGTAQIFALIPGISRSGVTMVGGLYTGLDYEDAARFSFLLATPIILAAGILELPKFFGSNTAGFRGELLAGALVAGLSAYFSVKFLDKYFRDKTFKPFATYCIAISIIMLLIGITGIRHF